MTHFDNALNQFVNHNEDFKRWLADAKDFEADFDKLEEIATDYEELFKELQRIGQHLDGLLQLIDQMKEVRL
tara:strand:- start:43 stop:258 length:216 start_codon:yes stop_codon:yes gene_type:complete